MLTKEIADIEKEIEKIEEQYKNCGFVFNHSSRETDGTHKKNLGNNTQPLYVWDWTCGKEVSICPRCKNRLNTNSKLKTLKQKLSTLKSAQAKFDKFVEEEVKWLEERKEKELECYHDCGTSINLHYINKRIKELSSKQEETC
jgi:uncharacterized phage infection (PIP) family protein YhgE